LKQTIKKSVPKTIRLSMFLAPFFAMAAGPIGTAAQITPSAQNQTTSPAQVTNIVPDPAAPPIGDATAPTVTQPKSLVMVDSASYVIGAEDVLQVTVWKEPSLTGTFPVRPDGMISMVLVGDVPAAGLTPMQLGKNVEARLKKFIQDPSVSVVVTAVNSQRIFVVGEVGKVGPLMLSPGMTPLQALSAAGGVTTFANSKHIYILRGLQGKQIKIPFNYKLALKGDNKQLISLQPGDTIVVP
jgi:polysaccharide export outer membrane protein